MEQFRVLVVDDESRMRKLVRDFLARSGFQVLEAENGEEAVDLFFQEKNIDLFKRQYSAKSHKKYTCEKL